MDDDPGALERSIEERQGLQRREVEDFLLGEITGHAERQEAQWRRDYSSIDAYVASVEPNKTPG